MKQVLALLLAVCFLVGSSASAYAVGGVSGPVVVGQNQDSQQTDDDDLYVEYYDYCPYGHPHNYHTIVSTHSYSHDFAMTFVHVSFILVAAFIADNSPYDADDVQSAAESLWNYIQEKKIEDHSFLAKSGLYVTEITYQGSPVQYSTIYRVDSIYYADSAKTDYVGTVTYYYEYF